MLEQGPLLVTSDAKVDFEPKEAPNVKGDLTGLFNVVAFKKTIYFIKMTQIF